MLKFTRFLKRFAWSPVCSEEQPWIDLATLVQIALIVFKEGLPDGFSFGCTGSGRTATSLEALLSTEALTRDEDIRFATSACRSLAATLGHGAIRRVVHWLLNITIADHLVLFEVISLAELMVTPRSHDLVRSD